MLPPALTEESTPRRRLSRPGGILTHVNGYSVTVIVIVFDGTFIKLGSDPGTSTLNP